jgi:hypothetical protein
MLVQQHSATCSHLQLIYLAVQVGVSASGSFYHSVGDANSSGFYDAAAVNRARPYHRIEIPITGPLPPTWWVRSWDIA